MNPIAIVIIGMLVVVLGILVLRLHAFLALILGALVVAGLTPYEARLDQELRQRRIGEKKLKDLRGPGGNRIRASLDLVEGMKDVTLSKMDPDGLEELVFGPDPETGRLVHRAWLMSGWTTYPPLTDSPDFFLADDEIVLRPEAVALAYDEADETVPSRVVAGFGNTATEIGILIAMAAVIGMCLLESGAAERIVNSALAAVGEKRAPIALSGSSFLLAVPVFFDTVFYLLIPLGRALRRATGKHYTLYIVAIVAGGTMAHSLVPPTPGPLLVAEQMGVKVGAMMIGGTIIGLLTVCAGLAYAYWINARLTIPLRDENGDEEPPDDVQPQMAPPQPAEAAAHVARPLPPLWLSLLPIALPVVLITLNTALGARFEDADDPPAWWRKIEPAVALLGDKNFALILGAAAALVMLVWQKRRTAAPAAGNTGELRRSVQKALESGGVIILITAAGGAFGHVLKQTDIARTIGEIGVSAEMGLMLLPLAFLITALVRTAQGSATVAMITAGGVIAPIILPMVEAGTLPFHPLYMALAIGCGSKPISWMNDSGFWVIGRMSGMTETETLKTSSSVMIVMAITGLAATMLGAWLIPLV